MSESCEAPELLDSCESYMRADDAMGSTDGKNRIIDSVMSDFIECSLQGEAGEYEEAVVSNHVANEIILTEEEAERLNMEAEQSYAEAERVAREKHEKEQAERAAMEEDGFQVIGKKGKAKGPKQQSVPGSSKESKPQPSRTQFHIGYAAEAEIRPAMNGDKKFPFCFLCSCRHDFNECGKLKFDNDE